MKNAKKTNTKVETSRKRRVFSVAKLWTRSNKKRKFLLILAGLALLFVGSNYAVSYWYMKKHQNEPLVFGTTFIPSYARYFELDPQATMQAMIDELGIKRFRLVSYWDEIEKTPGIYDFSELDWQFQKVEEANGTVSLSVGLRQPRWPECHMPEWAKNQPRSFWYPKLKNFMTAVVERYRGSPSLESYQVENEYFMTVFGKCEDFSRDRLIDEYNLVKQLDSGHPVIISRSNNWGGVPLNEPTPDQFAISVYKRVWDKTVTKRYFEYPHPPWFYGALAGFGEIVSGKSMIVHELQMEPWLPDDKQQFKMNDVDSIPEQNKSLNAQRLKKRFEYGKETGMRTLDTWGSEWWYWRKVKANDPSLWNVAAEEIAKSKLE